MNSAALDASQPRRSGIFVETTCPTSASSPVGTACSGRCRSYGAVGFQRIPKGFYLSAKGCEPASYPGSIPNHQTNPERVASPPADRKCNPVEVGTDFPPDSQGSACGATLGWMTESRWDSWGLGHSKLEGDSKPGVRILQSGSRLKPLNRSAPVPGRRDVRNGGSLRAFQRRRTIGCLCARGRAHSASIADKAPQAQLISGHA